MSDKEQYLLLDSWGALLARGVLAGAPDANVLRIQMLDRGADAVISHEIIQVLGAEHDDRAVKCRLLGRRGDFVELERLEVVDSLQRQNLRIPICFESFLYPTDGKRKGRMAIRSVDLSCGGIAYYAQQGLQVGDIVELVIPITEQPLIVHARILRVNELKGQQALYAARFFDLCHEEEKMIRRAVFSIQIRSDRG